MIIDSTSKIIRYRFMPMLEPEYVADEVIAGILTNEMLIILPSIIKYMLSLK